MNRLSSLLIVLVVSLVVVTTAFAAPPVRDTIEYVDDYGVVYCGDFGVGDFWISNNEIGTVRTDTFYDQDGNWSMEKGQWSGTAHLYVEGSDKVVAGKFVFNWTAVEDPETGLQLSHWPGNWWHINLPGYGNLVHFAGMENWEYDPRVDEWILIKEAGLRSVDWEFVCEYLAPPP